MSYHVCGWHANMVCMRLKLAQAVLARGVCGAQASAKHKGCLKLAQTVLARVVCGAQASAKHKETSRRGCLVFCYQVALMIDARLSIDYPTSLSSPDTG